MSVEDNLCTYLDFSFISISKIKHNFLIRKKVYFALVGSHFIYQIFYDI